MNTVIHFIGLLAMLSSYSQTEKLQRQEIFCLAKAVYHEARGESVAGQIAVAHTVLNRKASNKYPDTVCKVVDQKNQFTDIHAVILKFDTPEWRSAVEIAGFSYIGFISDNTDGALYYYNPKKADPYWAKEFKLTQVIDNHNFMKEK